MRQRQLTPRCARSTIPPDGERTLRPELRAQLHYWRGQALWPRRPPTRRRQLGSARKWSNELRDVLPEADRAASWRGRHQAHRRLTLFEGQTAVRFDAKARCNARRLRQRRVMGYAEFGGGGSVKWTESICSGRRRIETGERRGVTNRIRPPSPSRLHMTTGEGERGAGRPSERPAACRKQEHTADRCSRFRSSITATK